MRRREHWLLGVVICLIFIFIVDNLGFHWYNFSVTSLAVIIGIVLVYSILPDMDEKNSTITWWFLGLGIFGLIVGIFELVLHFGNATSLLIFSTLFILIVFVSAKLIPHRGIIHTLQFGVISVIPLWFIFNSLAYCMLGFIAWYSHLLGDGYLFKTR